MMKIAIGIITIGIVGLMTLIAGLVSAQEPNTITGKVTDATTGEPIQGATVVVEGADPALSVETDASGVYQITGVSTGEHRTTASAEGYESETAEAEVTDSEGVSIDFSLEPVEAEEEDVDEGDAGEGAADEGDEDGDEDASEDADEEEDDDEGANEDAGEEEDGDEADDEGKKAGDRRGYVGIFTPGNGLFTVTTKKGEVMVQIPGNGLESITRVPGQADATGSPEDGARVAVLVEFVDKGAEQLVQVARQIIVKPSPQPPIVGAVVRVEADENGVRTLTIMRPDGTTKEVQLGPKAVSPEVGELVTAFRGRGKANGGNLEEGPPVIRGLVRAEQVRRRLEGFLQELTATGDEPASEAAERRAQRVADVAAILENHTSKHVDIIERLSKNDKLPPQAVKGMLNGLEKAQAGRANARERAADARAKAGRPADRGDRGGQDRGRPGTQDDASETDRDENSRGDRAGGARGRDEGQPDPDRGDRDRDDRDRDQDQSNGGPGNRGRTG